MVNDPERNRRLRELTERIQGSVPVRLWNEMASFDDGCRVVWLNTRDLSNALEPFRDGNKNVGLFALGPNNTRPKLDAARSEVSCRLFNFLASAVSVVDYTKGIHRRSSRIDRRVMPEYKDREAAVRTSSSFAFVEFLRDRGLHVRRHGHDASMRFDGTKIQYSIHLDRASLLQESKDARGDAKVARAVPYLETLPEQITMGKVIAAFNETGQPFVEWFARGLNEAFRRAANEHPEFVEQQRLVQEFYAHLGDEASET